MSTPALRVPRQTPSTRWFVLAILLVTQLLIQSSLYGPAAAAIQIRHQLMITNAQFGLAMGTANIATTFAVVFSSLLVDRVGVRGTLGIGLALLGLGGLELLLAGGFYVLLSARVTQGIGIGIIYPAAAASIMEWFLAHELAYANTIFVMFAHVGSGVAYIVTAAFLKIGLSWTATLAIYGAVSLVLLGLWSIWGRNNHERTFSNSSSGIEATENSLRKAVRMPVIWLLGIGLFAARSVAEMYLFFLPLYLQKKEQTGQVEAAHLASLLPFASFLGVLLFGLLARRVAFRRPLLWISAVVVLIGSLPVAYGSGYLLKFGLIIIGCGVAGLQPVQSTYLMSLSQVTPSIIAAFFVITNLLTHIGGFVSPIAAGRLSETSLGMRYTLLLFSFVEVIGLVALLLVPPAISLDKNDIIDPEGEPL